MNADEKRKPKATEHTEKKWTGFTEFTALELSFKKNHVSPVNLVHWPFFDLCFICVRPSPPTPPSLTPDLSPGGREEARATLLLGEKGGDEGPRGEARASLLPSGEGSGMRDGRLSAA